MLRMGGAGSDWGLIQFPGACRFGFMFGKQLGVREGFSGQTRMSAPMTGIRGGASGEARALCPGLFDACGSFRWDLGSVQSARGVLVLEVM